MATGKISRLPREIREQVNEKLDAGVPGNRLVAWLNGLPAVRALLAAEFGGAAINEQNLSNWKRGGFREWRMEQEARAVFLGFGFVSAESQGCFEPAPSPKPRQNPKILAPNGHDASSNAPAGAAVPVVTPEQLSTVLAIRYLTVIHEWQQSPMPTERRWRRLRVMLHDVMKLRRGELQGQRLELDRERLEFAIERSKGGKLPDEREAMVALLGAARHWPEVGEALVGAFRLLQERKETAGNKAELGSIKVNQGEKVFHEEEQTTSADCLAASRRGPSRTSRCSASELAGQGPAFPVMGAQMDENLAKLKPIKVNQGEFFYPGQEWMGASNGREEFAWLCAAGELRDEDWPSCVRKRCRGSRLATAVHDANGQAQISCAYLWNQGVPTPQNVNLTKLKRIKVDQGEILFTTNTSRMRTRTRRIRFRYELARHPPPHALAAARAKGVVSGCACAGAIPKSFGRFYMTCPHRFRQAFAAPQ